MNLNDLLNKISTNGCQSIEVKHLKAAHGNSGGAGDYKILELSIGGEALRFVESTDGWRPE